MLGAVAERLKQSAILGYLAAGMLLGPHALNLVAGGEQVTLLAELGVALLLFSIGLEFPWSRLKRAGAALAGGGLQLALTIAVGAGIALALGEGGGEAFVLGAMLALSSTAYVLRILSRRAAIDSPHGRLSIGVLLAQDVAVVPLVLVASVVVEGESLGPALLSLGRLAGFALLLVVAMWVLFHVVAPRLLGTEVLRQNRELPLLLAITSGLGSAIAAHQLGISPAIGAFLAGMLLAESPFATQIRSDVSAMRTVLMTLFFGSIGMLGNPAWIAAHLPLVLGLVLGVVLLKSLLATAALRLVRSPGPSALAAGVCLAQVGEFSFVLAEMTRGSVLDDETFQLVVSVTIATLALTPYLISFGPWLAARLGAARGRREDAAAATAATGHVLVVGYGPTGEAVGRRLRDAGREVHVVDLNPRLVERAQAHGHVAHLGDATHPEVLEHAAVGAGARDRRDAARPRGGPRDAWSRCARSRRAPACSFAPATTCTGTRCRRRARRSSWTRRSRWAARCPISWSRPWSAPAPSRLARLTRYQPQRARLALEGADDVVGDPAGVEGAGLGADRLAVDRAARRGGRRRTRGGRRSAGRRAWDRGRRTRRARMRSAPGDRDVVVDRPTLPLAEGRGLGVAGQVAGSGRPAAGGSRPAGGWSRGRATRASCRRARRPRARCGCDGPSARGAGDAGSPRPTPAPFAARRAASRGSPAPRAPGPRRGPGGGCGRARVARPRSPYGSDHETTAPVQLHQDRNAGQTARRLPDYPAPPCAEVPGESPRPGEAGGPAGCDPEGLEQAAARIGDRRAPRDGGG